MRSPAFAVLGTVFLATTLSAQIVSTVAGDASTAGLRDGFGTNAQFNRPTWVDVDRSTGAIYVVDRANQQLRKIVNGAVSTIEVQPAWWVQPFVPTRFDFGGPYGGGIAVEPASAGCGGNAYAHGIFISSSAMHQLNFITDLGLDAIFSERDDATPIIGFGEPGAVDGEASLARFNNPGDVALSWNYGGSLNTYRSDALYVADTGNNAIRRIRYTLSLEGCAQPKLVETLAAGVSFNVPRGVAAAPDGSVYVADTGNHTIRRIDANGTVTTVAGKTGIAGHHDGLATDALLNSPSGIDINAAGEVFIADTGNFVVRKLMVDGRLITIAGTPGVSGYADGPARVARFSGPIGLRLIDDALYIADTANNVIRKLDLRPSEPRRRAIGH
jgi:hypothetical protein